YFSRCYRPWNLMVTGRADSEAAIRHMADIYALGEWEAPGPSSDPDRRAAEWVLSKSGVVSSHQHGPLTKLPLPAGEMDIEGIGFNGNRTITDDDLRRLAGLKRIQSLKLDECSNITDVGIGHLASLKSLN